MKKSSFSDTKILSILKQAESGLPVPEICRECKKIGDPYTM
jgi:putative transposase